VSSPQINWDSAGAAPQVKWDEEEKPGLLDRTGKMLDRADTAITSRLASNPRNYRDLAHTQIEVPKTLGRELYSGAKTILGAPSAAYHAFADEPTAEERERFGLSENPDMMERAALGAGRMVYQAPTIAIKDYASGKVTGQGALEVLPEALGQGSGTVVGGKLAETVAPKIARSIPRGAGAAVGRMASAAKPVIGRGLLVASDIVDPDYIGMASPRLAHMQRIAGRIGTKLSATPPVEQAASLGKIPVAAPEAAPPATLAGNVRTPGQIAPEAIRPRAFVARPAEPIPPRSGLMLKGEVATPESDVEMMRRGAPAESGEAAEIRGLRIQNLRSQLANAETTGERMQVLRRLKDVESPVDITERPPEQVEALKTRKAGNPRAIGKQLEASIQRGLGNAEPLERTVRPGVPLRDQFKPPVAEGHTPVESTAIRSYKYDPAAQELHVTTHDGITHVYGEVSPDQAEEFQNAESKGRAWKDIRDSSPKVAKVINGQRMASKPGMLRSAAPEDDLEEMLRRSVQLAQEKKLARQQSQ